MDFDKLFIIVFTIECVYLTVLFVLADKRWSSSEKDRKDAELWRHGQKPIGKLISVEEDAEGLKVTGQLFEGVDGGKIFGTSMSPYSIDSDFKPPTMALDSLEYEQARKGPEPEWEMKKVFFTVSRRDILMGNYEEWNRFVAKIQQVWIEMLRNEGYEVDETIYSYVGDTEDLASGEQKVEFEVKVRVAS